MSWKNERQRHSLASRGIVSRKSQSSSRGINPWKYTIDIKKHLDDYEDDDSVIEISKVIANELRAGMSVLNKRKLVSEDELYDLEENIIESFEYIDEESTVEDFDYILNDLYDWSDVNRVWLGL